MRWPAPPRPTTKNAGLGVAAISYIAIDYLRQVSPAWHSRLMPLLWIFLALAAVARVPYYRHWSEEFRSLIPFVASILFMLSALLYEAISVRSVTAVLGLDWHRNHPPLPDSGQWILLALNEKLPRAIVALLRAPIIGLHHYLMLFIMLAFSVLFGSVKAPGFGLGARYMFTMALGRLLRAISFASTIFPSPRPWCADGRFRVPAHPHPWLQKYYIPYQSDFNAIRQVIWQDEAYGPTWYSLLKKAEGGCNDLLYSGHMLVAVLTAMAWTEAYGGYSSALVWLLVVHSAQREVRERHHYSVDCVVAIYVGILLWKMTGFLWSNAVTYSDRRLAKLKKIEGRLIQASKDSNMDKVRELLKQLESSDEESIFSKGRANNYGRWFPFAVIFFALTVVILAFTLTSDG
ncbi:hypothetical protein PIB30_020488 [Stylosanthes scabra]|uniref:Sphingomyelin synthase-like domain-containing protein n=1 Tax=Stylosanthes scabra TaxID=79078 RepID=A0ABU6WBP3_9FABA|nr:hypothetical protein [Stylosanthes scabra]